MLILATTLQSLSCADIQEACNYASASQATQGMASFVRRYEQLAVFCVRHNRVEDLYIMTGHFVGLARETIAADERLDDNQQDFRKRLTGTEKSVPTTRRRHPVG